MVEDDDTSAARALILDPMPSYASPIRGALYEMGFGAVDVIDDGARVEDQLAQTDYDILISDTGDGDSDCSELWRRIRIGATGMNPFAGIVAMTWRKEAPVVRRLAEAGVDDIWNRPVTASHVHERVRALINARKAFIVTSDYTGPDRRMQKRISGKADANCFQVPDFLGAKLSGDATLIAKAYQDIDDLMPKMWREHVRRLSLRLAIDSQLLASETLKERSEARESLEKGFSTAELVAGLMKSEELQNRTDDLRRSVHAAPTDSPITSIMVNQLIENAWAIATTVNPNVPQDKFFETVEKSAARLQLKKAS